MTIISAIGRGKSEDQKVNVNSWWHIAVNPTLGRLRQEEFKFIGSPGYIVGSRLP